jgi:hypothetical protein
MTPLAANPKLLGHQGRRTACPKRTGSLESRDILSNIAYGLPIDIETSKLDKNKMESAQR